MSSFTITTFLCAVYIAGLAGSSVDGDNNHVMPDDCEWTRLRRSGGDSTAATDVSAIATATATAATSHLVALSCRLSAINSAAERTNFSILPVEVTAQLSITCNDVHQTGRLEQGSFATLTQLQSLTIVGCQLEPVSSGSFFGVDAKLTHLAIHHSPAGQLRLKPDSIAAMHSLQTLDLSSSHLSQLPGSELCQMSSLRNLDLSTNDISSVSDVMSWSNKNEDRCRLQSLESLDLSQNRLVVIADGDFAMLDGSRQLVKLDLSHNAIDTIHHGAFAQLKFLTHLDLSHNYLAALDDGFLLPLAHSLRQLNLSSNAIRSLAPVAGMTSLEILIADSNRIVEVDVGHDMTGLDSLRELDLSQNQIEVISSSSVASGAAVNISFGRSLHSLRLANNRLQSTASSALTWLTELEQLKQLDLSANLLTDLAEDVLPLSERLTHLHLRANHIGRLTPSYFANSTRLLVVDLSDNRLTSVPDALVHLVRLQTLDMSANSIRTLHNSSLLTLSRLWRLQLSNNRLTSLLTDDIARRPVLQTLTSLQILDLSANAISDLPDSVFKANHQLQALRLDANRLTSIGAVFQPLDGLTWLNISANQIQSRLDLAKQIPTRLHWLDASHNSIPAVVGAESGHHKQLAVLDISFNSITTLSADSIPDSVEVVFLNDNMIGEVKPYTFHGKSRISKVDLSVNSLRRIDSASLRISVASKTVVQNRPTFFFAGNEIDCDCHMAWFKSINTDGVHELEPSGLSIYPVVADIESIYCRVRQVRSAEELISYVPLVEADNDDFLCEYKSHCFALCNCCDFDACDCEMTCPDACTCYHDAGWTQNVAVCSQNNDSSLPEFGFEATNDDSLLPRQLPMDATEIHLDGRHMPRLTSHTFIGRRNLRRLDLNGSYVQWIGEHTFHGLRSLQVLHLDHNRLTRIAGYEFETLSALHELHLNDNAIEVVADESFDSLHSLRVLTLHNNRLVRFAGWRLTNLGAGQIQAITLTGNPWSCACPHIVAMSSWLARQQNVISDASDLACKSTSEDFGLQSMLSTDFTSACNKPPPSSADSKKSERENVIATSVKQRRANNFYDVRAFDSASQLNQVMIADQTRNGLLQTTSSSTPEAVDDVLPTLAVTLVAFALILVLSMTVFVYRHTIRVCIFARYGVRVFDTSFTEDNNHCLDDSVVDASLAAKEQKASAAGELKPSDLVASIFNNNNIQTMSTTATTGQQPTVGKLFDVFISYSPLDSGIVQGHLANQLESLGSSSPAANSTQNGYKVFLHHRDATAASSCYVADTVMQAHSLARRTMVVVSDNYFHTEWSRYDYKSGLFQALANQNAAAGNCANRLIVVVVGQKNVLRPVLDRDPDLRACLKSAHILHWKDRLFWQKLRYALPDVPLTRMATNTLANNRMQQKSIVMSTNTLPTSHHHQHQQHQPTTVSSAIYECADDLYSNGGTCPGNNNIVQHQAAHYFTATPKDRLNDQQIYYAINEGQYQTQVWPNRIRPVHYGGGVHATIGGGAHQHSASLVSSASTVASSLRTSSPVRQPYSSTSTSSSSTGASSEADDECLGGSGKLRTQHHHTNIYQAGILAPAIHSQPGLTIIEMASHHAGQQVINNNNNNDVVMRL